MDLSSKIEAVLFFKGEPASSAELAKILEATEDEVKDSIGSLKDSLAGRGLVILEKDNSYSLRTSPDVSDIIETLRKEELSKDIGKAGLETLSILLYRGPSTRAEIDYIRGVNSTFSLRMLTIRGLVERVSNPNDARSFLYKVSFELLAFLGISKVEDLPNYTEICAEIMDFEKQLEDSDNEENNNG